MPLCGMHFRILVLIALLVAGGALGAASGFVTEAPAGPQPASPVRYYDPLP